MPLFLSLLSIPLGASSHLDSEKTAVDLPRQQVVCPLHAYHQTVGQFKNDIVYELVVGQWIR